MKVRIQGKVVATQPKGDEEMKRVTAFFTLAVLAGGVAYAGVHNVGYPPNANSTIPFETSQPQMRFQTAWWRADINEAGPVSKVELFVYSSGIPSPATFYGCRILLCPTPLNALTNNFANNYGGNSPTEVFNGTLQIPVMSGNAAFTLVQPTNFTFNNTQNLLIEISWTSSAGPNCPFWMCNTNQPGRLWANNAGATTGTLTANYSAHGRITIGFIGVEPTSLGRVKALYK